MSDKKPEININDEREIRLKKLADLREAGVNPYPAKSHRAHSLKAAFGIR